MGIKEKLFNLLQSIGFRKVFIFIFSISLGFMFVLLVKKSFEISGSNSADAIIPSVDGSYKFNLQGDMNRLECTFEQRRCYYNLLGASRGSIIKNCHEINFCETLGEK
jgi:hypothetical protein